MELNDVPLLTVDPADGQSAPVFKCLHSVWYDEDKEQEKSDIEQAEMEKRGDTGDISVLIFFKLC